MDPVDLVPGLTIGIRIGNTDLDPEALKITEKMNS